MRHFMNGCDMPAQHINPLIKLRFLTGVEACKNTHGVPSYGTA